jgi:hypothetical protein
VEVEGGQGQSKVGVGVGEVDGGEVQCRSPSAMSFGEDSHEVRI